MYRLLTLILFIAVFILSINSLSVSYEFELSYKSAGNMKMLSISPFGIEITYPSDWTLQDNNLSDIKGSIRFSPSYFTFLASIL